MIAKKSTNLHVMITQGIFKWGRHQFSLGPPETTVKVQVNVYVAMMMKTFLFIRSCISFSQCGDTSMDLIEG